MQKFEATHAFTLPSGVECEVREMGGLQQRILTESNKKSMQEKLVTMLASLIVRVGDDHQIDEDYVMNMTSADRRMAIVVSRQFAHEFEEKFKFTYKYLSEKTNAKEDYPLEIDLKDGMFSWKPQKNQYTKYADVLANKEIEIELPRSKVKVKFTLLDGVGENIGSTSKKDERSSHTAILIRQPKYYEDGHWVKMEARELDMLSMKDIEYIRAAIKEHEGQVDTELMFEHPEAELLPPNKREVVIDLLGQLAFFYHSEAV